MHSLEGGLETQALQPLSHVEQCALWYVAGYIIHSVYEKIQSISHPKEEEMSDLLVTFSDGEINDSATQSWMLMINRGGLWQVSNQTYGFFFVNRYRNP